MERGEKAIIDKLNESHDYWLEKLSDLTSETTFPYDEFITGSEKKESTLILIDEALTRKLAAMSKDNDMALYVILAVALEILLYKISGSKDAAIATSAFNVQQGPPQGMIILRSLICETSTFKDIIFATKEIVSAAYKNQSYSTEKIINQINQDRHISLYKTMLMLEGINHLEDVWDIINSPMNDISFIFGKKNDKLECKLWFNSQLYRIETVKILLDCYLNSLKQVTENREILIKNIELVNVYQRRLIISNFNNTKASFTEKTTMHHLFEAQVKKDPNAVAISCSVGNDGITYQSLTYRELDDKACCFAGALREKGVQAGQVIGIMLDRSIELAVSILTVQKLGCAYLPLDPDLPEKRIEYMLVDSNAKLLVTRNSILKAKKNNLQIDIFEVDHVNSYNNTNFISQGTSSDLVYVIYTSGSTGEPKGVMIEHGNLVNYIQWRIKEYKLGVNDISMQLVSVSFDGFAADFYSSLLSGGRVVMVGDNHKKDFRYINMIVKDKGVTNLSIIPSVYRGMLVCDDKRYLNSLRFVVLAGEKMDRELVELSNQKYPHISLNNEYGPTENSVTTTAFVGVTPDKFKTIGKPIANNTVYIADTDGNLVPPGIKGELYLSGDGLSKGYINKPELTTQQFVDDLFFPDRKMYKTGDKAKWLPDGNIEFFGRIDHQIKIRGIRIEPSEIEYQLVKYAGVNEALVTDYALSDGNTVLCAYYVAVKEQSAADLKRILMQILPEYMVPTYLIRLNEMPKLLNGKIDRKSLPAPENLSFDDSGSSIPQNSIENKIAEIWKEILGIENVKMSDSFFAIGGDSLKAMQMSVVMEKYGLKVEVKDLFLHPKISELSKYVKQI